MRSDRVSYKVIKNSKHVCICWTWPFGKRAVTNNWIKRVHEDGCLLGSCTINSDIALMMKAANTSKTSANFHRILWHKKPEDSHFHTRLRENLKPHQPTRDKPVSCNWTNCLKRLKNIHGSLFRPRSKMTFKLIKLNWNWNCSAMIILCLSDRIWVKSVNYFGNCLVERQTELW
jgi:hypothetical protein